MITKNSATITLFRFIFLTYIVHRSVASISGVLAFILKFNIP